MAKKVLSSGCTLLAAPKLQAQGGGDKEIKGVNLLFEYYVILWPSLLYKNWVLAMNPR